MNRLIEVCLTPSSIPLCSVINEDTVIVVADILRATTTICAAFDKKAQRIIPVSTIEKAVDYKNQGFFVAAERGGKKLDFADTGNSPLEMLKYDLSGLTIVLATTNGTVAIKKAALFKETGIGSFSNFDIVLNWLKQKHKNILIVCAGWENCLSLEDTLFAGALIEKLLRYNEYSIRSDESVMALDIWKLAKNDVMAYVLKGAHPQRLKKIGQDDSLEYCFQKGMSKALPVYQDDSIIDINSSIS